MLALKQACHNQHLRDADVESGKLLRLLPVKFMEGGSSPIYASWSPDGKRIASGGHTLYCSACPGASIVGDDGRKASPSWP